MTANTKPIFTLIPDLSADASAGMGTALVAAANDFSGVSVNNLLVFTSGAVDGSYIRRLHFEALGTNVQTVARIFLNNGSSPLVAANNRLIGQMQLPATTVSANAPTGVGQDFSLEFAMNPGWKLYVGLATAVAAGYVVTPIAGKYS